jgi:hypothetical protein
LVLESGENFVEYRLDNHTDNNKKKDTVKLFRDLRPKYKIAQSEVEGGVAGCQGASH